MEAFSISILLVIVSILILIFSRFVVFYIVCVNQCVNQNLGVLRTDKAYWNQSTYLGKSERHNLHSPADKRNLERDKEEIPLENEEL